MTSKLNCHQVTSNINAIKSKKAYFDGELVNGNTETCMVLKNELFQMIKELKDKLWPFEQEDLSRERLTSIYDQYKQVFEEKGIVKNGQIVTELLPDKLKSESFAMPTAEQFLEYIASKSEELKQMIVLGLVEPVIVPIAADFGVDSETGGVHEYTGLLGVLAKEIRDLGKAGTLKGSDGNVLPARAELANGSADPNQPIFINAEYQNMLYSFKNKGGTFDENLTQEQFIQKHKEARSPFPGFGIYFKEKGGQLTRTRDKNDPLFEMKVNREYEQYQKSLRKLGLTGSTAHAELVMLLASLQKDGNVTRDDHRSNDAMGFIGGNTFLDSFRLGRCDWSRDDGWFGFFASLPNDSFYRAAGVALGELV